MRKVSEYADAKVIEKLTRPLKVGFSDGTGAGFFGEGEHLRVDEGAYLTVPGTAGPSRVEECAIIGGSDGYRARAVGVTDRDYARLFLHAPALLKFAIDALDHMGGKGEKWRNLEVVVQDCLGASDSGRALEEFAEEIADSELGGW